MSRLLFDIETDGLLDTVSKVHCIVTKDLDTGEVKSYYADTIQEGVSTLSQATTLVGHNIISYDLIALNKLFGFNYTGEVIDTLVMAKLLFPDLSDRDYSILSKQLIKKEDFVVWSTYTQKEVSAVGRQSLEAWGLRLGYKKDSFGRSTTWEVFCDEMLQYCIKDVEVNFQLYKFLEPKVTSQDALQLELKVQSILTEQEHYGWFFDTAQAEKLYMELLQKRACVLQSLELAFPGWDEEMKTPDHYVFQHENIKLIAPTKLSLTNLAHEATSMTKSNIKDYIVEGPKKIKHIAFNPNSSEHVVKAFNDKYNWVPTEFTENGKAKIDSYVLSTLEFDEAKLLLEYETVQDRIEKLAEGRQGGWMSFVKKDNRIHGAINPIGTATFRATHRTPNISQVPASYSEFGKECRSLFTAPSGKVLVGTDAASQELRCLAHEMATYDRGSYALIVTTGDAHTTNMRAFGVDDRDVSKRLLYAMIYGAGHFKLGSIISGDPFSEENERLGQKVKNNFMKNLPAYKQVMDSLKREYEQNGYIIALDGRKVPCRSAHSALNFKLQSSGAIITKRWMSIIDQEIKDHNWTNRAHQVGWIHDELQFEVDKEIAEEFGNMLVWAMSEVEAYYKYRCPLEADYKIGYNWSQTH